jgi:hypothetical protein
MIYGVIYATRDGSGGIDKVEAGSGDAAVRVVEEAHDGEIQGACAWTADELKNVVRFLDGDDAPDWVEGP